MDVRERIDPEVRARLELFLELVGPQGLAGIEDIPERRRRQAELAATVGHKPRPADVLVTDEVVDGLLLRTYRPSGLGDDAPCVYYLHGGGLVAGSVDGDDGKAASLAGDVGCVVVAVEYRLAPEHPFPAALDDAVRGLRWVLDRHPGPVGVFGSSAGGGLAVAAVLRLRDEGGALPSYLMLVSPMLDDLSSSPSALVNTGFGAWSREANLQSWQAYLGETEPTPYAAPARARDLSGLPPTFLDTGDLDLLRDETIDLARRLMWAGVPVELHVHPGQVHGGESLAPAADVSRRARAQRVAALTGVLRPQPV